MWKKDSRKLSFFLIRTGNILVDETKVQKVFFNKQITLIDERKVMQIIRYQMKHLFPNLMDRNGNTKHIHYHFNLFNLIKINVN